MERSVRPFLASTEPWRLETVAGLQGTAQNSLWRFFFLFFARVCVCTYVSPLWALTQMSHISSTYVFFRVSHGARDSQKKKVELLTKEHLHNWAGVLWCGSWIWRLREMIRDTLRGPFYEKVGQERCFYLEFKSDGTLWLHFMSSLPWFTTFLGM